MRSHPLTFTGLSLGSWHRYEDGREGRRPTWEKKGLGGISLELYLRESWSLLSELCSDTLLVMPLFGGFERVQ